MTGFNKFIEKSMFRKEFTGFGYTDIKLLISSTPTVLVILTSTESIGLSLIIKYIISD